MANGSGGAADIALAQRLVQTVLARGGQLPAASRRSLADLACRCVVNAL